MQISRHTTKHARSYRVLLDGALVEHWLSADDVAGVVVCEVADTTGSARFMRQEQRTGTVVIELPAADTKAE